MEDCREPVLTLSLTAAGLTAVMALIWAIVRARINGRHEESTKRNGSGTEEH